MSLGFIVSQGSLTIGALIARVQLLNLFTLQLLSITKSHEYGHDIENDFDAKLAMARSLLKI